MSHPCTLHFRSCGTWGHEGKAEEQVFPWLHCHPSGSLGWCGHSLASSLDFQSEPCWDQSSRRLILGNQIWRFSFWKALTTKLTLLSFKFKVLRSTSSRSCILTLQMWNPGIILSLPHPPFLFYSMVLCRVYMRGHVQQCRVASHSATSLWTNRTPPSLASMLKSKQPWVLLVLYWEPVLLHNKRRLKW